MDHQLDYLQREADYQDLKITNNPRAQLEKLYGDASSKYRSQHRKEMLGDLSQKHVLDLGCGDGLASLEALRAGAYVTAIDISPKSIEYLLSKAREAHLENRLNAMVMDAHNLEIDDGTIDVVFGNGILHHLPDLDRAISEIRRILKANGHAVFMEPLGMNPFLNLFRKATPNCRTLDEQPCRMQELNLIKKHFPNTQFLFFDCTTLIAKVPLLLGLKNMASGLQKNLISLDDFLIRRNKTDKITFLQKMSWMVVIKMSKE